MKKLLLLFMASATFLSCSSDKDEQMEEQLTGVASIVGDWEFTELNADGASASVELTKDVLTKLVADGCDLALLEFKDNNTVTSSIKDHTKVGRDVKPDGTGLLIECPEFINVETSVWSMSEGKLTLKGENEEEITFDLELTGDELILPGEYLDKDNLEGTKIIFKKK